MAQSIRPCPVSASALGAPHRVVEITYCWANTRQRAAPAAISKLITKRVLDILPPISYCFSKTNRRSKRRPSDLCSVISRTSSFGCGGNLRIQRVHPAAAFVHDLDGPLVHSARGLCA